MKKRCVINSLWVSKTTGFAGVQGKKGHSLKLIATVFYSSVCCRINTSNVYNDKHLLIISGNIWKPPGLNSLIQLVLIGLLNFNCTTFLYDVYAETCQLAEFFSTVYFL